MAQQKKTDKGDTESAWESLTENRKQFVVNLASGMNNIEAYKSAGFSVENMSDASISVEASRIKNSPKVSLVLAGLAADRLDAAKCTREDHMRRLASLSIRAELDGNYGAAVQAEQLRGKVEGHYVDQTRDVTEENPLDILERIAELNPGLAQALAQQRGIQMDFIHEEPETVQ